jgi:ABC-2 type transport system permease protein
MAFWTLYKRELSSYFQSVVAYIVLFGSALAQGMVFITLTNFIAQQNYKDQSVFQVFFTCAIFWILLFIQIPLITMRVFSEEFKLGTIEMLLTAPVREWEIVLAKFFGSLTFFLILWLPVVLDQVALQLFSNPPPPVSWGQYGVTALTILLVGSFYVSLGIFTSVLTKNQIISAVLCFALIFATFFIALQKWEQHLDAFTLSWISYVSLLEHFNHAVQGLFDTRPVVYYVSMTAFVLLATQRILLGRRLKG